MPEIKKLKDIIISITDYPHMPYWATIEEAIVLLNFSYETGHDAVLVFDQFYKLLGVLHQRAILTGIHSKFLELSSEKAPIEWESLIASVSPQRLKKPIKDFMSPFDKAVDIEDHILKVAHLLLRHNTGLLPVTESDKVVGVVRMHDIFHEITGAIMKSKK